MKKRAIPKVESKDVIRCNATGNFDICITIPKQNSDYTSDDKQLIQSSSLNLVMHKFIRKLIEINYADKSLLQDIEYIIDDYLGKFYLNSPIEDFDDLQLDDDYLY